ncbi:MAG: hypothetical protein JXR70_13165 [Spirochaetales bacterium]|nr:hypothetical protein [Spirochaetales bacterium]
MKINALKNEKVWFHMKGNTIYIQGEIDGLNPESYLNDFFNQVAKDFPGELIIDLTELSYLNSRAISSFIAFLSKRKPENRIYFKINEKFGWQKRSIEILASLDPQHITILS